MQLYEFLVGLRYTRAKKRNHFISFITLISIGGMALGVMALIVVMSVMNGFQKEIRDRMLGASPHLEIRSYNNSISDWKPLLHTVAQQKQIQAAAPYVSGQGMLSNRTNVKGVMVRGIQPDLERHMSDIADSMLQGQLSQLQPGEFGIVIGSDLAITLGTEVGDKILLMTPDGQITPAGMVPRLKRFRVVGIFELGMAPYDSGLALIHLNDAQKLFRLKDSVTAVSAKLYDIEQVVPVAHQLQQQMTTDLYANDWTQQNSSYFRAVQLEKRMMFIILSLIIAVAAFNIVSTLVMAVTDKQADIAILRTLGASPAAIMKIFMIQGAIIGLAGTAAGGLAGLLLAFNVDHVISFVEQILSIQFLDKSIYYIDDFPSDPRAHEIITVLVWSFITSLLATLYPSYRAAKTQPAQALRYE